jgi:hypothetical protein
LRPSVGGVQIKLPADWTDEDVDGLGRAAALQSKVTLTSNWQGGTFSLRRAGNLPEAHFEVGTQAAIHASDRDGYHDTYAGKFAWIAKLDQCCLGKRQRGIDKTAMPKALVSHTSFFIA